LFSPAEDVDLLALGIGITNLVERPTARAALLTRDELVAGGEVLCWKVHRYRPKVLAVVGLDAYRKAFASAKASEGLQPKQIGPAHVWLLPNPSGLNAHHPPAMLARLFGDLRKFVEASGRSRTPTDLESP
jgi:TDG/mug DNA glycosylase family protein